jgi:hypothetical protein
MSRIAVFVLTALVAVAMLMGAESAWKKVQDLQSRTELRIYKKGAREPLNATFDEATEERIVVVAKNEQIGIAKDDIDRIDARALKTPRKVTVDSSAKATDPDFKPHRPNSGADVPGTSYKSSVNFGTKPEFETVYRRAVGSPKN